MVLSSEILSTDDGDTSVTSFWNSPQKKKKENQTVATALIFFFANVWLLCLGGPANLFAFLGVQTWEGLENLIKMQR